MMQMGRLYSFSLNDTPQNQFYGSLISLIIKQNTFNIDTMVKFLIAGENIGPTGIENEKMWNFMQISNMQIS